MELKDFVVTPLLLTIILISAFMLRPVFTTPLTRRYFIPALVLKMVCAILLGVLYQFYYGGGDTFQYHTNGSRILAEAIIEEPEVGIKLFFFNDPEIDGAYKYYSRIPFFKVPKTFLMLRIGCIFDLITFGTYSATALFYALLSFAGLWYFYSTLSRIYPSINSSLAYVTLFVPTVLFWGSGILRDTITLSALCVVFAAALRLIYFKGRQSLNFLLLSGSLMLIYFTKLYFVICLVPSLMVLLFFTPLARIRNKILKWIILVPLILILVPVGYFLTEVAVQDNPLYSLDNIAETARITAYDIGFYTGRSAGSTYSLGELDGTFGSMIRLAPEAIIVSLFRPFLWEIRNPLMLLSAIESFVIAIFTLYIIVKTRFQIFRIIWKEPVSLSFMVFAIGFAFAVGISTYNFGTLSRYRIPVLPLYLVAMLIVNLAAEKKGLPADE